MFISAPTKEGAMLFNRKIDPLAIITVVLVLIVATFVYAVCNEVANHPTSTVSQNVEPLLK